MRCRVEHSGGARAAVEPGALSIFSQLVLASPAGHKFAPTYSFRENSQAMRIFRAMDEDPESLWTVEQIIEAFDFPRPAVTSALYRLAKHGLIEAAGKARGATKPRILWRVK